MSGVGHGFAEFISSIEKEIILDFTIPNILFRIHFKAEEGNKVIKKRGGGGEGGGNGAKTSVWRRSHTGGEVHSATAMHDGELYTIQHAET